MVFIYSCDHDLLKSDQSILKNKHFNWHYYNLSVHIMFNPTNMVVNLNTAIHFYKICAYPVLSKDLQIRTLFYGKLR